jgi:hypothetical protein
MPNNLSGDGYKLSLKLFKLQQNLFFAKKKKKKLGANWWVKNGPTWASADQ